MSEEKNINLNKGQLSRILAIETSCDETAIAYMEGLGATSHHVHTQAALHAEFGGVFPNLAKREHTKNLVPVLSMVFHDVFSTAIANLSDNTLSKANNVSTETSTIVRELLSKEHELDENLLSYINSIPHQTFLDIRDSIDAVAVTYGPGLEPALWVGISFAKALCVIFKKPLLPINHMEGHIASVIAQSTNETASNLPSIQFPAIALLISGGHTELVHVESWHQYQIIGQTVDDAVGEAYDKAARQLGLAYPGGPEISKLADIWRSTKYTERTFNLPRPMIHTKDFNFSFSGLKTAVLYAIRDRLKTLGVTELSQGDNIILAGEFEEAVIDVLISKTKKALNEYGAKSLIIGGGVIANTAIRSAFEKQTQELRVELFVPEKHLSTDNAAMIGIVASLQYRAGTKGLESETQEFQNLKANGNLSL